MEKSGKVQYLEGIRGTAAMLVVFHHFFLAFYPSYYFGGDPKTSHLGNWELYYWRSPLSIFTNGEFMVCIFFVLSGFVLSRSYFMNNQIETLVSAASRRFLRLYIPVAFALILAYIVLCCTFGLIPETVALTHSNWLTETAPQDSSFKTFFKFLTYNTILLSDNRYVTSTWSIAIELYGSLMVFAILALTHKLRTKWVFFIITGIVGYYLFNDYYLAFMIGISLNYVENVSARQIKFRGLIVALLLLSGLVMGGYPTWQWDYGRETFYHFVSSPILINNAKTIHMIGASFILIAALLSTTFQKIFSSRIFVFLGVISFSAYLIHPIIVTTISLWVFLHMFHATNHYYLAVLISFLVTIIVTVITAKLMTVLVDKPGIKFSKYVYERFFKAKTA